MAVIPPELLEVIPGQLFCGKLDAGATRGVVEFTKLKPADQMNENLKGSRELAHDNSPVLREYQIKLQLDPMRVNGSSI